FRIPIIRGRSFAERDENGFVAIVNQTLAKQFWPDGDPLNSRIMFGSGAPVQVIGIAGDVRDRGLTRDPRPMIYVPSAAPGGLLKRLPWVWVMHTRSAPISLSVAIEKELRAATGGLPVASIRTMEQAVSRSTSAEDFNTLVLGIFACAAMLLA